MRVMDGFGIVYIIENAQQFWTGVYDDDASERFGPSSVHPVTELEDILQIQNDSTLGQLDATIRQFISFCASYHGASYRIVHSTFLTLCTRLRTILTDPASTGAFMRPPNDLRIVCISFRTNV